MARQTMADLIARVRKLIGDRDPLNQLFTDGEIQEDLDKYRDDIVLMPLDMTPTYTPNQVQYLNYYSQEVGGNWEADVVIQDSGFQILTPDTSDYLVGKWSFNTQPKFPLLITGKVFDLYATAVELIEKWSAQESLSFDFSTDNQSFKLSQKAAALQRLADIYRAKQKPRTARIVRDDLASDSTFQSSSLLDNFFARNY